MHGMITGTFDTVAAKCLLSDNRSIDYRGYVLTLDGDTIVVAKYLYQGEPLAHIRDDSYDGPLANTLESVSVDSIDFDMIDVNRHMEPKFDTLAHFLGKDVAYEETVNGMKLIDLGDYMGNRVKVVYHPNFEKFLIKRKLNPYIATLLLKSDSIDVDNDTHRAMALDAIGDEIAAMFKHLQGDMLETIPRSAFSDKETLWNAVCLCLRNLYGH